ncbi:hypothetical protein Tsubulata_023965 [Turnera subulata]|uniref:Transmembrane protein n=1 Tax=Turnera subulata TaxID=218843 RepID=A0A9Q0FA02_9ROSI|nr:hypothetical protein Tsubulata_023965 [Turnera subulata]
MVRLLWEENLSMNRGGFNNVVGSVYVVLWAVLLTVALLSTIIFSCADGVSRDKDPHEFDSNVYGGGGCAGCGAACGG